MNADVNMMSMCTDWNQTLHHDIRVPAAVALGGVEVDQSASCEKFIMFFESVKNTFYTSSTILSLLLFNFNPVWHRGFYFEEKAGNNYLSQSAVTTKETTVFLTHHALYCLLFIYTQKKRMYFSSQSQMLYLIQLCLFISLEGFNRWKLGSSVSNKLDKQTKSRRVECFLCRGSFQNAVYPLWKKGSSS